MTARVLAVDLGGVVCRFHHGRRLVALAGASGHTAAQVHALLWESGFSADCDSGRYTADEAYHHIRQVLGLTLPDSALRAMWLHAYQPDQAVLALLTTIGPGPRTALLTDNGPIEEDGLAALYPRAIARFDRLLFSYRLGARKPDPAIYTAAARVLATTPDSILLVDDNPANVAGARTAGWHAIQYRQLEDLATAITWAQKPRESR